MGCVAANPWTSWSFRVNRARRNGQAEYVAIFMRASTKLADRRRQSSERWSPASVRLESVWRSTRSVIHAGRLNGTLSDTPRGRPVPSPDAMSD
jgi:hypothetical protein